MKIATWNIERLKHKSDLNLILRSIEQTQADILVLTETDTQVQPNYKFRFQTPTLGEVQPGFYKPTENRVSIFTNYPCVLQHPTYDVFTALCVELKTEKGNLLVYGTIIGIYGNRHPNFNEDLEKQLADYSRLSTVGDGLCVCGDFNCTFADNYYFTRRGRECLTQSFADNGMRILTRGRRECIDHIAMTEKFMDGADVRVDEWNLDKALSDHKGISVCFD